MKTAHGVAGTSASTVAARRAKSEGGTPEPNTWGKYDCSERNCDRKGQHALPTPQALGRHRQAIHGTPGNGNGDLRRRNRDSEEAMPLARRTPRRFRGEEEPQVHVTVGPAASGQVDPLHYCPGCGFDLDAAKQHLHPSIRDSAYIRCPQCRINLAVVSAVLRPDVQAISPEHAMALVEAARRVSNIL